MEYQEIFSRNLYIMMKGINVQRKYFSKEKAFAIFNKLSKEEQDILIEENLFEPLSMVLAAYEYEDQN